MRAALPDTDYRIIERPSSLDFSVDERRIIMVKDIFKDGSVSRAGLSRIFDYGRPRSVEIACMVDMHSPEKIYPIEPQYSALSPHRLCHNY